MSPSPVLRSCPAVSESPCLISAPGPDHDTQYQITRGIIQNPAIISTAACLMSPHNVSSVCTQCLQYLQCLNMRVQMSPPPPRRSTAALRRPQQCCTTECTTLHLWLHQAGRKNSYSSIDNKLWVEWVTCWNYCDYQIVSADEM